MYGSIARYRLRPGMEDQLLAFGQKIREARLPGLVGGFTYRMDDDPGVYHQAVVFESREAYRALAESPEQDARYRELLSIIVGPPEWHDGEVVGTLP
jgi:heme-degrading monooxygenase HmoA